MTTNVAGGWPRAVGSNRLHLPRAHINETPPRSAPLMAFLNRGIECDSLKPRFVCNIPRPLLVA